MISTSCIPRSRRRRRSDAEAEESSDDDDVPLSQWQAQAAAAPWAVGDKVEAKFCVKSGQRSKYSRDFYPATIAAVHGDGTVDVEYDTSDEETEEQLPVRHVRKRRAPAAAAARRGAAEEENEEGAGEDGMRPRATSARA